MNLQLTGYRATGKTTVARHLARMAGWPFLDTDDEISRRAGKSIQRIFELDGEESFRDLESEVIRDVAGHSDTVLSLGGGAILREENRDCLKRGGKAVWLVSTVDEIHRRMSADAKTSQQRPHLTDQDPLEEIRQVLKAREPVYREFADLSIDTDDRTPEKIAEQIWAWFRQL